MLLGLRTVEVRVNVDVYVNVYVELPAELLNIHIVMSQASSLFGHVCMLAMSTDNG